MIIFRKRTYAICLLFTLIILFQSCRVYKSEHVSLETAVLEAKRVKIKTNDGETLKFKRIAKDSNQYFGLKKRKGALVKFPIAIEEVESVRLHNRTLSTILNVTAGVFVVGTVLLTIVIANISQGVARLSTPGS